MIPQRNKHHNSIKSENYNKIYIILMKLIKTIALKITQLKKKESLNFRFRNTRKNYNK